MNEGATMVDVSLATPADLDGIGGGPFTAKQVTAAGEQVRRLAGWHIAPEVTETLTLDSPGGDVLWLPTRHVVEVTAVRDVSGDSPRELAAWRWSSGGMLSLSTCFPRGFRVVEVDLTHGYAACPDDLLPVIAERSQTGAGRRIMAESLGSRSVSFGLDDRTSDPLNLYRLGPRA